MLRIIRNKFNWIDNFFSLLQEEIKKKKPEPGLQLVKSVVTAFSNYIIIPPIVLP